MTGYIGGAGRSLALVLAIAAAGLFQGCASITGSELQSLSLEAADKDGAPVTDADCNLSNDKGSWTAKPPAVVIVNRSAADLLVRCEVAGMPPGTVTAISRPNAGMLGNIIFGGGIGAIIDHNRGTAYDYPSRLRVVLGAISVMDKNDDVAGATGPPPAQTTTPAPQSVPPAQGRPAESGVSMDDLKGLLPKE